MRTCLALMLIGSFLLSLGACATIGPSVVREERNSYNEALHDTSAEQLLLNLVRAHDFEAPSFTNFAEVDSTPSYSAGLAGSVTNLGGVPIFGGLTPTLSAGETSIQKHVSVTGAELISQISRPITLQNIYRLATSNEPDVPLFQMSFNNISKTFSDFDRVIILIDLLDLYGAIKTESRGENTMSINFIPEGIVSNPIKSISGDREISCIPHEAKQAVAVLWRQLGEALGQTSSTVYLLRTPEAQLGVKSGSEIDIAQKKLPGTSVLTRSAFGALRLAETAAPFIFLSRLEADRLRAENSNANCSERDFYFNSIGSDDSAESMWHDFHNVIFDNYSIDKLRSKTRKLGSEEVFIIVEVSDTRPLDAYISIEKNGHWYSIYRDDHTSKVNFALLNLLLTIQAVPSAAPTATTINASAGR